MTCAFDTNILVYAEGSGAAASDIVKRSMAWGIIDGNLADGVAMFVPTQALLELHDVLVRKRGVQRHEAMTKIASWRSLMTVVPTSDSVLSSAVQLSADHGLRIFDAVILAAAAEAGCDQLLTEDLQAGFVWRGVEVVNPFV